MAQRTRVKLEIANPNAAGIDVGSASHFVAVPPNRDDEPVREFKTFTQDLERLADWLIACGIDTVAMESTGVYWIPPPQEKGRGTGTGTRSGRNSAGLKTDPNPHLLISGFLRERSSRRRGRRL